jgi:hypothetical protein
VWRFAVNASNFKRFLVLVSIEAIQLFALDRNAIGLRTQRPTIERPGSPDRRTVGLGGPLASARRSTAWRRREIVTSEMTRAQLSRHPTKAMTERAFAPYASEIGHLARSWNQLQENLCLIFTRVAIANDANFGRAIWYAVRSDLTQREMLKAACGVFGAIDKRTRPTALKDIDWLLNETNGLSHQRNAAVHLPFMIGRDTVTREMVIMPHYFANNRFSIQMRDKDDVLKELFYLGQRATV